MISAPALAKAANVRIRRRDHQVHVEQLPGQRPEPVQDDRTHRDVRHEMPVHHVHMDVIRARRLDGADFLAQPREIGREDREARCGRNWPCLSPEGYGLA